MGARDPLIAQCTFGRQCLDSSLGFGVHRHSPQLLPFICLQFPASATHQQHAVEVSAQHPAASLQLLRWLQLSGACVAPR